MQYRFHLTVAATLHGKAPLTQTAVEMLESKSDQRYKYFNAKIQTFPTNVLAGLFGFREEDFFEIEAGAREAPQVKF